MTLKFERERLWILRIPPLMAQFLIVLVGLYAALEFVIAWFPWTMIVVIVGLNLAFVRLVAVTRQNPTEITVYGFPRRKTVVVTDVVLSVAIDDEDKAEGITFDERVRSDGIDAYVLFCDDPDDVMAWLEERLSTPRRLQRQ